MGTVTLGAVGDVTAFHREPESGYEFVGPTLQALDVVFAQNERLYSTTNQIIPAVGWTEITRPERARALQLGITLVDFVREQPHPRPGARGYARDH